MDWVPSLANRLKTSWSFDRRSVAAFRVSLGASCRQSHDSLLLPSKQLHFHFLWLSYNFDFFLFTTHLSALVLLYDLFLRSRDLRAHYTDDGVAPRYAVLELARAPAQFNLHFISGGMFFQFLLFSFHAIVYVFLLVGYRTRLVCFISFYMLLSLQQRNPHVASGADTYVRVVLFWAQFLPLNDYFSVDNLLASIRRYRQGNTSKTVSQTSFFGIASIGLITQFICIYLRSWYVKTGPSWNITFDALYYSLHLLHLPTFFGKWAGDNVPRTVLRLGARVAMWWEFGGALLLVIPFFNTHFRYLSAFGFILFHASLAMCFDLSTFFIQPLSTHLIAIFWAIPMATSICFLPSHFWNSVLPSLFKKNGIKSRLFHLTFDTFCLFPGVFSPRTPHLFSIYFRKENYISCTMAYVVSKGCFLDDCTVIDYRTLNFQSEDLGRGQFLIGIKNSNMEVALWFRLFPLLCIYWRERDGDALEYSLQQSKIFLPLRLILRLTKLFRFSALFVAIMDLFEFGSSSMPLFKDLTNLRTGGSRNLRSRREILICLFCLPRISVWMNFGAKRIWQSFSLCFLTFCSNVFYFMRYLLLYGLPRSFSPHLFIISQNAFVGRTPPVPNTFGWLFRLGIFALLPFSFPKLIMRSKLEYVFAWCSEYIIFLQH